MTDRESLLRTIVANPEDDAPRLVFADWLEENGEPEHAEFIRVQCELAQMGLRCSQFDGCRNCMLRRREREIGEKHGPRWIAKMLGIK